MKKTYTYILRDSKLNIYKIGKTTNPPDRFHSLCKLEEITPIALIDEDFENSFHELFDDNRIIINNKVESGKTEWFKKGGRFDSFLDTLNTDFTIPYLSPHALIEALDKKGNFRVIGYNSVWVFSQITAGKYIVGLKVLEKLDVIKGNNIEEDFISYADIFNNKVILNEELVDYLSDSYDIFITERGNEDSFSDLRTEDSLETKAYFKKEKIEFIILIKKSIIKAENYF